MNVRATESGDFRPGFRLSKVDIGVLIFGTLASILVARFALAFAAVTLFTLAHFFVFCNVLRMSRALELIWAVLFVALAGSTLRFGLPPWRVTLAAMLIATVILAAVQLLHPSYHGVFWQRLNPRLPQWWAANRRRD